MAETRKIICIICPMGCHIEARLEKGEISELNGYSCQRGKEYAQTEINNPVRVVTSTVRIMGGELPVLPVKTSKPISKALIMKCMEEINSITANAPVDIGDVILKDILGTGADIISTRQIGNGKQNLCHN